jgi:D-alanyl-lipoteichoic acid acyltransferase DltB (MBOAT superfamily)
MDFITFKFNTFIIFSVVIFYLFPNKYRNKVVIPLINVVFIATFLKHPLWVLPLAVFLMLGFMCVKIMEKSPNRRNIILSILGIAAAFIYLKKYAFLSFIPGISFIKTVYLMVGLSYVLFRILHIVIDIYGGAIKEKISFWNFFSYSCFFLSFVSGPIQRFQEFKEQQQQLDKKPLDREVVFKCFSRIINGYIKIAIVAAIFFSLHNEFLTRVNAVKYSFSMINLFITYSGACFLYTLFLYYNFSGYMDVVIGVGRLLGFELPENFNRPFMSKSFLEFWSCWHITLANWFKFYIFNPLVKRLTYQWPNPKLTPYYGVVAFFVTFLLMGIWHGSSFSFLIYGLFLGSGVSINKLYDVLMRKYLGKKAYTNLSNNKIYILLSTGLVYSYFSIGLTCIWLDFSKLKWVFDKIGVPGFLGVFVFGGLLASAVIIILKIASRFGKKIYQPFHLLSGNFYFQQGCLSFKAFVLFLFVITKIFSIPHFIYKVF